MKDFHKGRAMDATLDSDLPTHQKLLLVIYIRHADKDGRCWPGGMRLAKQASASLKSVKRHRAKLIEAGILSVSRSNNGQSYRAQIHPDRIQTGVTESPGSQSHRGQRVPTTGVAESPPPGSESPLNIHSEYHTIEIHTPPPKPPKGDKPDKVKICFDKLSQMRADHRGSRAQPLKLTKNRRRQLAGRLREYSEEEILLAWEWWHTSTSELAITLRQSWDIDTFLRPSKHDRYQIEAQKEAHRDEAPAERPAYMPLTEEEQEKIRQDWLDAKAEKARQDEEESWRRENELRALLGKPPHPRLQVLEGAKA